MMAVVLLTCFFAMLSTAYGADKAHQKKHDLKRQVEMLEEQWRTAQLAGDVSAMDKMLAEDFIGISMSGQVNTKAQQLDRIKTRKLVVTKIDLSDRKIKLVGSIAIVTSKAEVEGMAESGSMKGLYRYTRIYQRLANGAWKITSFEATRVNPPHPATERTTVSPHSSSPPSSSTRSTVVEPRFG